MENKLAGIFLTIGFILLILVNFPRQIYSEIGLESHICSLGISSWYLSAISEENLLFNVSLAEAKALQIESRWALKTAP